jgi:hypothetical protein
LKNTAVNTIQHITTMATRLIDKDERTRKKPMRILVLGMCRTGTSTLSAALRKLGYTPHQMREVLTNPKDLALWQEAINVTLIQPRDRPQAQRYMDPYGVPEFDKLLADHDVVMDLPGCVFAKELVEAYPDAKVILTTRDYADWEKSMQDSLWCFCTWRVFALVRYLNVSQMAPLMHLMHAAFRAHNGNAYGGPQAKAAYEHHYDTVRSIVPKSRLLEMNPDESDWAPLCTFLDRKVPEGAFPKAKEDRTMRAGLESAWWNMVQFAVLMVMLPAGAALLAYVFWLNTEAVTGMLDVYVLGPGMEVLDEYVLGPGKGYLEEYVLPSVKGYFVW